MVKKAAPSKSRRSAQGKNRAKDRQENIAAVIAELEEIKRQSAKAAKAITLFQSWLSDESGYDERVWPRLKKALQQERERVGAGRLFDG
jgi:hypothetical protein